MSIRFMKPKLFVLRPVQVLLLLLVFVTGLIVPLLLRALPEPGSAASPLADLDFGRLPLSFMPNAGQTDPAVHFQAHDMGTTIFFTSNEVVFSLPATDQHAATRLSLRFDGANPDPEITGAGNLPGVVNYAVGNDPAAWHTGLPTFERVVYHQLYPGIDLYYDGRRGALKGTYMLAPGADPGRIRWRYQNISDLQVDAASGNLLITLASGKAVLPETAPYAWQDINGQRIPVDIHYLLASDGSVGFTLGTYDPAHPLVIDPTIVYSSYLGGSGLDEAEDIAIDSAGNVYVTGGTSSNDFPGNPVRSRNGSEDVFVAKINPAGTALVYTTYLGGSRDEPDADAIGDEVESSNSIAVDRNGNAYITGATDAIDFPTTPGVLQPSKNGPLYLDDAFVARLSPNGSLSYSTYLGGNLVDEGEGIAVDSEGYAYVVGMTASSNFPTTNPLQSTFNGNLDAFVVKLNPSASALVYGTYLGGSNLDLGSDIAIDSAGNAYVVGASDSSNFPTTAGVPQTSNNGFTDVFIAKLNAVGNSLIYSTYLGGNQYDTGYGIALDRAGNAYVTGSTASSNFPTVNPLQASLGGCPATTNSCDAFVAKLNTGGTSLVYSTYLGGNAKEDGFAIAVNGAGEAYVTGWTDSGNFPIRDSLQGRGGGTDAFVTRLSANGNSTIYSTYLGGDGIEVGNGIAVDDQGSAYITGSTISGNFPLTNAFQSSKRGIIDSFVAKLGDPDSPPPPPIDPPPSQPSPEPSPEPAPEPWPDAPPTPRLAGSYKIPAQSVLFPGATLTYQIVVYNNGTAEATVKVTDQLPPELDYVSNTVTNGGTYDAASRRLTWNDVKVPAGGLVVLAYAATPAANVNGFAIVTSTATISSGDNSLTLITPIILLPTILPGDLFDRTLPVVQSLTIGDQDVVAPGQSVQLKISASDNKGISEMYVREWYLDTTSFLPRWDVVRSSNWVSYAETYDWEIGTQAGIHYVGVWVKDTAGNISLLDLRAIDFASVIQNQAEVQLSQNRAALYAISYPAGTTVTANLTTIRGDADLYVWYPGSFLAPNQVSTNDGTAGDTVSFTTSRAGIYLFLVSGFTDSTYNLSINPVGGPRTTLEALADVETPNVVSAPEPAAVQHQAVTSSKAVPDLAALLGQIGLDPLGSGAAGTPGPDAIYLPLVTR